MPRSYMSSHLQDMSNLTSAAQNAGNTGYPGYTRSGYQPVSNNPLYGPIDTNTPTINSAHAGALGANSDAGGGGAFGSSYGPGGTTAIVPGAPGSGGGTTPNPLQEASDYFSNHPDWTYYQAMDDEAMNARAREYSDLYSTPLYQELERKLEQAIMDASAQEGRIHGAFAGTHDAFSRREAEQRRLDLESAISRGAGRSGVVDHLSQQRQGHFSELIAAEEAKKSAELMNIANQLGLIQRQVPDQRMQIAEQGARLSSQELARLQELDYGRRREHDLDQWQRAMNVFDRTMLTPAEQLQLYVMLAESGGSFPDRVPSIYGT